LALRALAAIALCAALWLTSLARGGTLPTTQIDVNGNGGDRVYAGVGAILGGGGTAPYLSEYPAGERKRILRYLFEPGYGASLQLLKLEVGDDGNSTDGSEPSIEHTQGEIRCHTGYEFEIARQALAINPELKLYGLQWGAPGWVGHDGSLFTKADIGYLLDWLRCAGRNGLKISYLGGWNERDDGTHASWFRSLRTALDAGGYRYVKIVAGDDRKWEYAASRPVAILGVHDNCGYPTGIAGPATACAVTKAALASGKPLWGSELGAMAAGAGAGCVQPCAPALDRAFVREYVDARVTGALEWPALISMPAKVLPHENRGLLTADQPWSGNFRVNAMTWAIAQITQFVWPPSRGNPGGWRYVDSASGYLQGTRADGSYVTLVRATRDQWSTIIETTAVARKAQRAAFTVKGGHGLAGKTVHVWTSNFNPRTGKPSAWFVHEADIKPTGGKFTLVLKPGYVYSLTTTTGQGKGTATGPSPASLRLPYHNNLATGVDGEPSLLAAQMGAFELRPCAAPDGAATCAQQTAVGQPVFWRLGVASRHPYAVIGSDWQNYAVTADVMVPGSGSAGLMGRYDSARASPSQGTYDAYVFDVRTDGTYAVSLYLSRSSGHKLTIKSLASGTVPFAVGVWHRLGLSLSGPKLTASVDGVQVAAVRNGALRRGIPGIETGGWYPVDFSDLRVTRP
jgi:hypothetical protein